jgi:WD40 repeat protein
LLDASTGAVIHSFNTGGSTGMGFSADSQRFVLSNGNAAQVWEVESGNLLWTATVPNTKNGAVFSPDDQYVLIASFDHSSYLLDAATGEEIRRFQGHIEGVFTGVFSPDSQYVLTASLDQTARLWDVATGEQLRVFKGHTASVYSGAFSPDGNHILTTGRDTTVRQRNPLGRDERGTFSGAEGFMYTLSFSPDGQSVFIGTGDTRGHLFDVATGQQIETFTHETGIFGVHFSADSSSLLTGSFDGIVRLWDSDTGEILRSYDGHIGEPAFSADGRLILAGALLPHIDNPDSDKPVTVLWDALSGEQLYMVEHVGVHAFSNDTQYFALTNGDTNEVFVYETASGNLLNIIQVPGTPLASQFSPDNRTIATGGRDNMVRLWDVATGQLVREYVGHTNTIWHLAFAPDGNTILSSSFDRSARLWDVSTGEQLRYFPSYEYRSVSIVAYSPDSRFVLIGSTDGTAQIADVSLDALIQSVCNRLGVDFSATERVIYSIRDENPTCP